MGLLGYMPKPPFPRRLVNGRGGGLQPCATVRRKSLDTLGSMDTHAYVRFDGRSAHTKEVAAITLPGPPLLNLRIGWWQQGPNDESCMHMHCDPRKCGIWGDGAKKRLNPAKQHARFCYERRASQMGVIQLKVFQHH